MAMAQSRRRIVIVGASLAGATAAVTLRDEGFEGEITLIGAEAQLPYNRPPLSKGYLRGEERFEGQLVKPASYYQEQRIDLRLGVRATAIDAARKHVELEGGARVPYDGLLVTSGGRNRALTVPGADLGQVFQLRTVDDCDRIRAVAARGRRAVVIGLGFIGSEVSASLRQLGLEVAAVEGARAPLARVLGEEVGQVLADIHREKGVELVLEDSVAALEGTGRVERVRTRRGRILECDLVIAGIGILPNAELLQEAGADVDNGVLVDAQCRTSLPDVFAAGDVTNHWHPIFGRLRVEHWNNGDHQGRAAARALLGSDAPYDYIHTFWSDQYEHVVEYVGFASSWDRLVFRGRPESRAFLGFYLKGGIVQAAVGLDRGGDPEDPAAESELKAAVSLIRHRTPVDPARLADDGVDLRHLAAPPAPGGRGAGFSKNILSPSVTLEETGARRRNSRSEEDRHDQRRGRQERVRGFRAR
jgi:3-phenylpropionate/trans-cinnamate dioxygenase ferredoxin reductase subunit